jgi:hypothetical protein
MSKKFEQLLDYLVNEEMDKANELFHEIVVEKSREIYENMIAEEAEEESVEEADDMEDESVEETDDTDEDPVEEGDYMDDDSVEEGFGDDSMEPEDGDETSMSIGGTNEPSDSLPADIEEPDMGEEVSQGEEQILDILAQLKSEFEDIVAKNGAGSNDTAAEPEFGDNDGDGDHDMDDHDMEKGDDDEDDEEDKEESMGQPMREYIENVGMNWEKNAMKSPGPVGSGKGDKAGQTAVDGGRSPVSSGKGKPTTGATAHNILGDRKAGAGTNTGTSPAKADMGVVKSGGKFVGNSTHNVDNVKSGVKTLSKVANGHGAEKKGSGPGPVGSGSGDKAGQTSVGVVKSPLNGAPGRNA